jgi:hypothetical protein
VPLTATSQLGWRGMLRARTGFTGEAAADLTEATRRVEAGVTRSGGGMLHVFLGFAHWLRGDWSLARGNCRTRGRPHRWAGALPPSG